MSKAYPTLLLKYLKTFQENPKSRIFAPLAECYRKIGEIDEAIAICKEGIAENPDFVGGKVALARAYYDKKMYSAVREVLATIVQSTPDNLMAQKLYADASIPLGYLLDAVNAYKLLLYFNPYDQEAAAILQELETQNYESGGLLKGKLTIGQRPDKVRKLVKLQNILAKFQHAYAQRMIDKNNPV